MTPLLQPLPDGKAESGLQRQVRILGEIPAGGVRRSLGVLPAGDDTDHHLQMPLGLHVGTHDAETHQRGFFSHDKCRNDGVIGAFPACNTVRMTFFKGEPGTPVLKADRSAGDDDPRPETLIVRLDV